MRRPTRLRGHRRASTAKPFALFVDVLGTQNATLDHDVASCRKMLRDFHYDLDVGVGWTSSLAGSPTFVAEFSDSAYVVADKFEIVAEVALWLMRHALAKEYPLRGGIGVGGFWHEMSGASMRGEGLTWSTSSFMGRAVVTAYQAERSRAPGLRVFVHPDVMLRNTEPFLKAYTVRLPREEQDDQANCELRYWAADEVDEALPRLCAFRDKQQLSERAARHYAAAVSTYERFSSIEATLPHSPPLPWPLPCRL